MKFFLTLKHWQLFVLLMGTPFILQLILMVIVFANHNVAAMMYCFPAMMVLCTGLFFGWFYALGLNLYKKLPATAPMNLTLFKVFLFIPVAYILLISVFAGSIFYTGTNIGTINPDTFWLMFLVHLFSMCCIFYCLYFNAKALKAAELQRPVTFSDFAGEFFLLWFFPVGIWILQPRINKLFDATIADQSYTGFESL